MGMTGSTRPSCCKRLVDILGLSKGSLSSPKGLSPMGLGVSSLILVVDFALTDKTSDITNTTVAPPNGNKRDYLSWAP